MPSLSQTVNSQQLTINKRKGFTLIELLVVITIIAILIAAGAVSYTNAQRKGRDARRKSDLKAIQQGLDQYFSQNGKYPAGSSGSIQCNVGSTDTLTWGTSAFTCNSINYLDKLPKDPTSQSSIRNYPANTKNPTIITISAISKYSRKSFLEISPLM